MEMLCGAIDVLLPTGVDSCCHDSLLVLGALPVADLVSESTPEDVKAAALIAQQMIESACKTTLAAGAHAGRVDEHDLHPIVLLLPLVIHALALCGDADASTNQQRVAWHLARRAASLASGFMAGAGALPAGDEAALARQLQAARRELDETKKEADSALAFQKALADRLTSELEKAKATPSGGAAPGGTGAPLATPAKAGGGAKAGIGGADKAATSEKKPKAASGTPVEKAKTGGSTPAPKAGGGTPGTKKSGSKKKATTERGVVFAS